MTRVFAVNGSPNEDKGDTAMVLAPFLRGMENAGAQVELLYASRLEIRPCDCGMMHCWASTPGVCYHQDEMETLYPRVREADVLVLATPVYVPLPAAMQNFINRLVPLLDPVLETREGRTRARFREDVRTRMMVPVITGGWWEIENLDTVVRIVRELAEDASVEFPGAILRPHVSVMMAGGTLTPEGQEVLDATEQAGYELISTGKLRPEVLASVSRPLVQREVLLGYISA